MYNRTRAPSVGVCHSLKRLGTDNKLDYIHTYIHNKGVSYLITFNTYIARSLSYLDIILLKGFVVPKEGLV